METWPFWTPWSTFWLQTWLRLRSYHDCLKETTYMWEPLVIISDFFEVDVSINGSGFPQFLASNFMMTTWLIPHEISMAHPIGPREGGSFPDSLPQTPSDPGAKKPQMPWFSMVFPWELRGKSGFRKWQGRQENYNHEISLKNDMFEATIVISTFIVSLTNLFTSILIITRNASNK